MCESMLSDIWTFIFDSKIVTQIWNKILMDANLKFIILTRNKTHRFQPITFTIESNLKYWTLIHKLVMEYEKQKRIKLTYDQKMESYIKQMRNIKQKQLQQIQRSNCKSTAKKPAVMAGPQQEAENIISTLTIPMKPIKPEFVSLYDRMLSEAMPLAMSIVHDYIDVFRILGQEIARTNKVLCTELIFVEQTEDKFESYLQQSYSKPSSPTYKAIVDKCERREV